MAKRYITVSANGGLAITTIVGDDPLGHKLNKQLFELSRTSDMTTHFDPIAHTLEAIGLGVEGHRPLTIIAEVDDSELPKSRVFRDAWDWMD